MAGRPRRMLRRLKQLAGDAYNVMIRGKADMRALFPDDEGGEDGEPTDSEATEATADAESGSVSEAAREQPGQSPS